MMLGSRTDDETQGLIPQIDLGPETLLNFLHIPRTGGSSVRYILDHFFLPNWIVPAEQGDIDHAAMVTLPAERCKTFRVVRGHLCYEQLHPFLQRCDKRSIAFTILRRPEDRLLSEYDMAMNDPLYRYHEEFVDQNLSLEQFMDHPDIPWVSEGNTQTRHLALQSCPLTDLGQSAETFAKQTLNSCAVVGVQDKLSQCLQLLYYVLGLPPVKIPRLNAARAETRHQPSEEQLRLIQERNHLDTALYQQVSWDFDQSYRGMLLALGFNLNRQHPDQTEINARLVEHAALRRRQRLEKNHDRDYFEIIGSQGLLSSYLPRPIPKCVQWIGPKPTAQWKLQFKSQEDKLVYLDVASWADEGALNDLYMLVNETLVPLSKQRRDHGCVLTGFVPAEIIGCAGQTTRIVLGSSHVGKNHTHEIHPQFNPELPVSIALSGLVFKSAY